MQEFFPEIEVRDDQAEAIARGLMAVAKADGDLHPREGAMISELFASTTDRSSDLAALEREDPIDAATLAIQLPTRDLRLLFIKTAFLLAYADNQLGAGEKEQIAAYAAAMEIGSDELEDLQLRVKEYLLAQLGHVENVDAVVEVAKELKV